MHQPHLVRRHDQRAKNHQIKRHGIAGSHEDDRRAAQDEEDLLVQPVLMGRRGPRPGGDLDPTGSDGDRSSRPAQISPVALQMTDFEVRGRGLVEVSGPHAGILWADMCDPAHTESGAMDTSFS